MEHHYYNLILNYLRVHPHLGDLFIFLIAFSESLPLIGTIVPGSVTMTLVGVLIGSGALPLFSSFFIASVGAFAGDCMGFAVGYHYNERLRTMWPFKKHPQWLAMGESFFKKHGGKSIILGRFIGPARSTVPLVAGLMQLSWLRFIVASIPSAIMWAVMYMLPGILLGALSREIPTTERWQFFGYGLGILLTLWLVYWLIQHFFTQLARAINAGTDKLWNYLSRKNTGRFFIRFVTNQQDPTDHHQLTLLFTAILSGLLFLILFINVRNHSELTAINFPIFHVLQTIRIPLWNEIFSIITIMGMPKTMLLITVLFTAGLLLKKQWRTAIHFFVAFLSTAAAVKIFKHGSHSLRPQGFVVVSHSSSFPSGHTALSFVILSFMAFLIMQICAKKYRWVPYTLSSILIACVAFSRLYLGAHWFTDIIGSILLGLTILLLFIISYRRMPKIASALRLSPLSATFILLVSLSVPWSMNIAHKLSKTIEDTTPVWLKQKITVRDWWQAPLRYTPLYRNSRFGQPFQPFNVQFQGDLQAITNMLENKGWKLVVNNPKLKLKTTLQRFASHQAEYHMPLLPWLYQNKAPVIFLIKHIPQRKRIIELRLWESDIHFQPGNKSLWIGTTDIRIAPKILLSLKERTTITLAGKGGLNELYKDTSSFERKIVHNPSSQPNSVKNLQWNGNILLIRDK